PVGGASANGGPPAAALPGGMLQSTRLRAARSSAARNRAFFTWARNAIGSGPLPGADPCAPARGASAATANAAMAISNVRIFDIVPPVPGYPAHRPQRVRGV